MRYIVSPSNKKYISVISKISGADGIIAIGGGTTIDHAKLIDPKKPIFAVPTTASGAAMTSWAVVWEKNSKRSVNTARPILIDVYKYLDINLPEDVIDSTFWDCVGHIKDSRNSKHSTKESLLFCDLAEMYLQKFLKTKKTVDLIEGGNFAGRAIEITGTNFYHAISYVLTLEYGYEHGKAVKEAILMQNLKFNWTNILRKAQKYEKFHEARFIR